MLKITKPTGWSTILQSLIDMVDKDKIGGAESDNNETNMLNPSISKKFTGAGYLISESAIKSDDSPKSGGGNTQKGVEAAKSLKYLTSNAKKPLAI